MMNYKYLSAVTCFFVCINQAFALTIETIDLSQSTTQAWWLANKISPITADSDTYVKVINIVNEYLWFSLAAICVWVMVYVGIKLMTAQWDKAKMKQANNALVGMVIWLGIAYFSYTAIRMVANWF